MADRRPPPSPNRSFSVTEEARRRAIFRQLAHEERSLYIRERERTQPTETTESTEPTEPPQTREEALDRIRANFEELERNANRSRGVRSPLGWRPRSPSKLTARENEQATDLRLRISRRKAAWVEAEREARGRPEEIRRRTAEKFKEGARCDARAAGIAAVQNVRDVVESAVYRWRMRGEFGGVQGWEFGAVFEDFAKGFRERHEEEPESDEAWMSFTASIPREIRLRRERAGTTDLPMLDLEELADGLGQAIIYRLHLRAGFDVEMVVTAATGVILQLIDYEMVSAPVVYEWIQRKKQAEQDVENEVL